MSTDAHLDGFASARAARPMQLNGGSFVTISGRHREEIEHE
jgi:hypothetical protein